MAKITTADFDVEFEKKELLGDSKSDGAIVIFIGQARDSSKGKNIVKLELDCYQTMAMKVLAGIEREAKSLFELSSILILHRIGAISIGENILLVIAIAKHRKEAFKATMWAIDNLKQRAPIWKKEFATDGSYWIEEQP